MYISPISNNYYRPSFNANSRSIHNEKGDLLYNTTTFYFRNDLDWDKLNRYLCFKYNNVDKVNVFNHACSNGMEPYSFAMHMMIFHKSDANKFFPIEARDLNKENIFMAKKGNCGVTDSDFYQIKYYTNNMCMDYLEMEKSNNPYETMVLAPKKILKEKINFNQGDIFEDIQNMPRKNTVLLCRNFWPYLSEEKRHELAQKIANQFDFSSTIITGGFDENCRVSKILERYGFKKHGLINYVFEKLR